MKLYEFFSEGRAIPIADMLGDSHQYTSTGIVIFHTIEFKEPQEELPGGGGDGVWVERSVEQEYFLPYHAFDRFEVTEIKDSDVPF